MSLRLTPSRPDSPAPPAQATLWRTCTTTSTTSATTRSRPCSSGASSITAARWVGGPAPGAKHWELCTPPCTAAEVGTCIHVEAVRARRLLPGRALLMPAGPPGPGDRTPRARTHALRPRTAPQKYRLVGRVVGAFYDADGRPTPLLLRAEALEGGGVPRGVGPDSDRDLQPCNSKWSQAAGGHRLCSLWARRGWFCGRGKEASQAGRGGRTQHAGARRSTGDCTRPRSSTAEAAVPIPSSPPPQERRCGARWGTHAR